MPCIVGGAIWPHPLTDGLTSRRAESHCEKKQTASTLYYLCLRPNVFFPGSGTHTLRIQQREDGATVDQIVLSPQKYFSHAPGPRTDDGTILSKTQ